MGERRSRRRLLLLLGALLAVLLTGASCAGAPELLRAPYLTDAVGDAATINWGTDQSSGSGRVTWGAVGSESCTAHSQTATKTSITVGSTPEYQWKGKISGLAPDASYCYRVFLGSGAGETDLIADNPSPEFKTLPAAGAQTPFSFAVIGDWGLADATGNPNQAAVLSRLAFSGARFAISSGDIGYPGGSQTNYGDLNQTGTDVSAVFGPAAWPLAGLSIPMYPALGNHGRTATFQMLWPQAAAASSSGGTSAMETYCCLNGTQSRSYPSNWYAFDAGSARIYVLDTSWSNGNVGTGSLYKNDYDYHWTPSSAEYKWLEQDLATHPAQVKLATFHFPLYSANADESSDTYLQGANSLEGLLSRYGVDVAFNGHAHIYQRNRSSGANGLISYVTGGGGAKPSPVTKCSSVANVVAYAIGWSNSSSTGSACGSAPTPTSIDQLYHYLLVTVDGNRVTVTPTDAAGRTFDVQSYVFQPDNPVPDTEAPTKPQNLAATVVNSTRVDLDWTASTDNIGVAGYRIYRSTGSSSPALLGEIGTGNTYSDTTAQPGTTYEYTVEAFDAAGNVSAASNPAPATTPGSGPAAPSFVRDRVASVSNADTIDVTIPSTAGDMLTAAVAIRAGVTNSVLSVTDSAGNTWTPGPVGYLNGSNTRIEIWHSSATAAVNGVQVKLKKAADASANIAEFTGPASANPLDVSAGIGNPSSTTASMPAVTTTQGSEIILAAINYPKATTATLATPGFTALDDFGNGSAQGYAAYRITSSVGSYSASWNLGAASTSGAVIAAFKVGP